MTDENKDIENNKEENHNIPEYNKSWWKFVGLNSTYIIFSFVIVSEAMI